MSMFRKIGKLLNLQFGEDLNVNFDIANEQIGQVNDRVDTIITGGGPDKDPEVVDIRTPDPDYTPLGTITTAGGMVRDMQKQHVEHLDDIASLGIGTGVSPRLSTDLNSEFDYGLVITDLATLNRPRNNTGWWVVLTVRRSPSNVYQTAYRTDANVVDIWIRKSVSGVWLPWVENAFYGADSKLIFGDDWRGTTTWEDKDLNDITKSGFYWAYGTTANRPTARNGLCVHGQVFNNDNFAHQLFFDGRTMLFRQKSSGAWESSWQSIITDLDVRSGAGSPEGVIAAAVSTIYRRTDGSAGTTLYVKQSGSGNTGWKAVQTI